jgi:hypothetical protein
VNFAGVYQALADTNGTKTNGTQFNNTDHVRADVKLGERLTLTGSLALINVGCARRANHCRTGAFDDAGVQGVFNFAANQTASSTGTGGDPFASFLLGLVNTSSRTFNGTGIRPSLVTTRDMPKRIGRFGPTSP